jgi:addiction module HigA family antidote
VKRRSFVHKGLKRL